jgi:DNA-binding GntR family transcriptional regulator
MHLKTRDTARSRGALSPGKWQRVCVIAASADIAEALGVTDGTLVLMSDRVVHLRDGRPAEWRVTYSLDQENLARLIVRL